MVCLGLNSAVNDSIAGLLAYPTTCDHYFWAKILGAIFFILVFSLYYSERKNTIAKPEFLSIMGVSSLVVMALAGLLSLLGASEGIIVLPSDVLAEIIALGALLVALWLFKR